MGDEKHKLISQEFKLEIDQELRFEVESKSDKVHLILKSGTAEVFGTELVKGKTYDFTYGAKIAIFTWHGCTIEVRGKTDVIYVAKETPMVTYANCHAALEFMRMKADEDGSRGPIAMVVGPTDVGKSTLCRILLNYAVRMGRRPIFVELDVGQGQVSIPGAISALLIERPANIIEGFSQEAPFVYHFGHKTPSYNPALFNIITSKMADVVHSRLEVQKKTRASGAIINTCGWIKNEGYQQLLNVAKAFKVDVMLVLDQERLYNELVRDVPQFVKVVFLQKSGGVVERSKSMRMEYREQRIREYFYGTPKNPLYPHSFDVKWSDFKVLKIGAPVVPDTCLPAFTKAQDPRTKLVNIAISAGVLNRILAVSFAEDETSDEVIGTHVAGFVCISHVDLERQVVTLLSPQPKPLPNTLLLMSDLQFMDNH